MLSLQSLLHEYEILDTVKALEYTHNRCNKLRFALLYKANPRKAGERRTAAHEYLFLS